MCCVKCFLQLLPACSALSALKETSGILSHLFVVPFHSDCGCQFQAAFRHFFLIPGWTPPSCHESLVFLWFFWNLLLTHSLANNRKSLISVYGWCDLFISMCGLRLLGELSTPRYKNFDECYVGAYSARSNISDHVLCVEKPFIQKDAATVTPCH